MAFSGDFPQVNSSNALVTENFATFLTARKEICHLELARGAASPNYLWHF